MHFTNVAVVSSLVAGSSATLQYKRGLAANDDIPIGQFGGSNAGRPSHITWQYNWDSTTTNKKPFTDEYVPLLWGTQDYHTNQWHANAQSWINKGTTHLMSFNEPERPDQANLTPAAAVAAYKQYMQPFAGTARLGAPAVSNDGHDWIVNFLNQCNGCEIDFIPVHWYNDYTLEADFENWVHQICNLPGNRPVWITEVSGIILALLYLTRNIFIDAFIVPSFRHRRPTAGIPPEGYSIP